MKHLFVFLLLTSATEHTSIWVNSDKIDVFVKDPHSERTVVLISGQTKPIYVEEKPEVVARMLKNNGL